MTHPASMVMTRIGGEDYPMRFEANCYTCQSPHRMLIENMLIEGRSYTAIATEISTLATGTKPHPSGKHISAHVGSGHMPLGAGSQRRLIERRAKEIGSNIEDGIDDLVDTVVVNQMIVARGFQRMQRGEIEPEMTDVIAASRMLHQIEQSVTGGVDEAMWRDALMAYLEVAQQFVPQALWQDYSRALSKHPVLKAISEAQNQTVPGEVA